jgi:50S ribosomal protein L16 3-hydroxylase
VKPPAVLHRLGHLTTRRFLREFWQRKPALIRNALPGWHPPVDRDRLWQLTRDRNAESRLIVRTADRWSVRHGPFPRLPAARSAPWTVLLQGVDLLDEGARELLSRFRFVSDARLDDLMASYATPGGGVGPHVDSYDVFLLQASGRRRWRISRQRDLELRTDAPLRLLADFRPSAEWILEPGDLLYLPPGVAHEGVAIDDCVTYSIGFRAPGFQELLEPWITEWAENVALAGRYTDPGVPPTAHPGALRADMTARVHQALTRRRPGRGDTERFLLRYLTEPKATVIFSRPRRPLPALPFVRRADVDGLRLNRASRMLYARGAVAINGECHRLPAASQATVRRLADHRELAPGSLAGAVPALVVLLHDWYTAGWLSLQSRSGNAR